MSQNKKVIIIEVYNVKGGIGKTTLVKALASGFANGLLSYKMNRYKVCVIDKDPLKSCFNFYNYALEVERTEIQKELSKSLIERRKEYEDKRNVWENWSQKYNMPYFLDNFSEEVITDPKERFPFEVFESDKNVNFEDYDVVIVDHPPRFTRNFYDSSLIIMPTRLESESFIPTYEDYIELIKDRHTVITPNCYNESVKDQKTIFNKYFKYEDEGTETCLKNQYDSNFPTRGFMKERACYQNTYLHGDTIFGKRIYQYLHSARKEIMSVYSDIKFQTYLASQQNKNIK
ncbi:ParA family protein [Tatumella sp. JGM130]|uniref:ParA family protein n=1 Tax=Tatumella sp. JGM130 TaxID=2799797 RepID=UPI001BAFFD44|nr:ParA family protein [Tatumella sp. JGM130]MBS0895221.1 ParA family protein [Tatumella sp. JGM130]